MRLVLTLFLALVHAEAASAYGPSDATAVVAHIFDTADANGDGALTAEEYTQAGLERFGVSFEACDADGDGRTTFSEYLELYEMHHRPAEGVAS